MARLDLCLELIEPLTAVFEIFELRAQGLKVSRKLFGPNTVLSSQAIGGIESALYLTKTLRVELNSIKEAS